jgi:hypothetical protein
VGSEESEDEDLVTKVNLEVDASMIAEITITRTGAVPITVLAESASPADNEPSTLEPQMVVRGLGMPGPSSSVPPPSTSDEISALRDSEVDLDVDVDEDDQDERTTQNLDSHVQLAYERALSASASAPAPAGAAPVTHLSPILMTPSEPIRLDAIAAKAQPRRPAPIPAAGRPPEPHAPAPAKEESAVTARAASAAAEIIRAAAATDDYDEETKTDAVQSELAAFSRAQARTVPVVPVIAEDPGLEAEETRTAKAPLSMSSARAPFMDAPPAAADSARSKLDVQAAAGGTVRMFYDPATGKATAHPESERNQAVAQHHLQAFGEQPTVQALPVQQNPALLGPPAIVQYTSPAALPPVVASPKRRGALRNVLLFLFACAVTGGGVYFWPQLSPRIAMYLPVGASVPTASAPPAGSAPSAPESTASAIAAVASPEPSAAPAPSAVASSAVASASASALRNGKKRVPPPPPTKK